MGSLRDGLALGFELTSFLILSFIIHKWVAEFFEWDENLVLTGLFGISLILWTLHAFLYTQRKDE